jgi:hypothetical protein
MLRAEMGPLRQFPRRPRRSGLALNFVPPLPESAIALPQARQPGRRSMHQTKPMMHELRIAGTDACAPGTFDHPRQLGSASAALHRGHSSHKRLNPWRLVVAQPSHRERTANYVAKNAFTTRSGAMEAIPLATRCHLPSIKMRSSPCTQAKKKTPAGRSRTRR